MARPEAVPDNLLLELGIDEPRELDIEAIAQYCGATVLYEELEGCEARLTAGGDRAIITIDPRTHYHRRRFSTAHELGHWMLDRHRRCHACTSTMIHQGWSRQKGKYGDAIERRANRWAADLLMPERLFVPEIRNQPQILDTARDLTRTFSTSLFATALRLVRFGQDDSMLVWSRPGQRWKWFYRSPHMPAAAWPLPEPGPWTVAYRLLRGDRGLRGPQVVRWEHWLDMSRRVDPPMFYLTEDSMLMRNGEVLSLLWFDDPGAMDYLRSEQSSYHRMWAGNRG